MNDKKRVNDINFSDINYHYYHRKFLREINDEIEKFNENITDEKDMWWVEDYTVLGMYDFYNKELAEGKIKDYKIKKKIYRILQHNINEHIASFWDDDYEYDEDFFAFQSMKLNEDMHKQVVKFIEMIENYVKANILITENE